MHRHQLYEWDLYPGPTLERYELHQPGARRVPAWLVRLIALLAALILAAGTAMYIGRADAVEPTNRLDVERMADLRERAAERANTAREGHR